MKILTVVVLLQIAWRQTTGCSQRDTAPLGMINGDIRDWQITASSSYPQEWDQGCHPSHARLYQKNKLAWCSKYKSASEWLQVDLGVPSKVVGVMTQGRGDGKEWVTSFKVSYGVKIHDMFEYVKDAYGNQKIFDGNTDSFKVKHSYLDEPIMARYIKFHVESWNRHPSMRVEVLGCQECKKQLGLPPNAKISASQQKNYKHGSSCLAEYGHILSNKGWCPRRQDDKQWLQFDLGPPTEVTGVITKGREDTRRDEYVRRYRLSFSNDSLSWYFYMDETDSTAKTEFIKISDRKGRQKEVELPRSVPSNLGLIFGGNLDKYTERSHFLSKPFTARFVRFHPVSWSEKGISMRAGILGCPYTGECGVGFVKINNDTPCVENLAYRKESFISDRPARRYESESSRRSHQKRHMYLNWKHGQAARAVDGNKDTSLQSCTILDNSFVETPVWKLDLGTRTHVKGFVIHTWQNKGISQSDAIYQEYKSKLDKIVIYVDKKRHREDIRVPDNECGRVTRVNDALFKPRIHIECQRELYGRYVFIEAFGVHREQRELFSAVLCEVEVY